MDIVEQLKAAGPYALFVLMFYFWQLERKERVETQKALIALATDGIKAINNARHAINTLRITLFKIGQPEITDGDVDGQ